MLEESPSVLLLPETRLAIQRQAAMLAKAVKYRYSASQGLQWERERVQKPMDAGDVHSE